MTNDLGTFTVSGEWMKACGYGSEPRTYPVLRVMEFPGRGEGFERFFKLAIEGADKVWVVAELRGVYLPAVNDLTVIEPDYQLAWWEIEELERPGGCGAAVNPYILEMEDAARYLPHDPTGRAYQWYVYCGSYYSSLAKREIRNLVFSGTKAECEAWIARMRDLEAPGGCGAARNMVVQAITTRFLGPTNMRGSRIKAKAAAGSVTVGYDHALNVEDNHLAAALALVDKLGWREHGEWHQGGLPDDRGYCFVCVRA